MLAAVLIGGWLTYREAQRRVRRQRQSQSKGALGEERIRRLGAIGFGTACEAENVDCRQACAASAS